MKSMRLLLGFVAICAAGCASSPGGGRLDRIETIVVIYAENRSFDHLYGLFPGAEGIAQATTEQKTQLDHDDRPLPILPAGFDEGHLDPKLPKGLPNGPFQIDAPPVNRRADEILPSPVHKLYRNREQINGGRNNKFVALSDAGAWVMGYYDGSKLKLWKWAQDYTLADHFFMGAFGDSFLNHQWLVCACAPVDKAAPASQRAQIDPHGNLKRAPNSPASVLQGVVQVLDGRVTHDGYAIATSNPPFQPSAIPPAPGGDYRYADPARHPLPPQTAKTIGDTLSEKGVSWAWFAAGWNEALADGQRDPKEKRTIIRQCIPGSLNFQPHHQPFNYFGRFAPGTPDRARHLRDGAEFEAAIDAGTLPQVSFYKPNGKLNQHPYCGDLASGDEHIAMILERLRKSPQWTRMAVIVTYDENGGFWDHVPPPSGTGWGDRWGPGTRIPAIIVSPFAKRGFVDKTPYDTTSILKLITLRFGLEPLPGVRPNAGDLTNAFE